MAYFLIAERKLLLGSYLIHHPVSVVVYRAKRIKIQLKKTLNLKSAGLKYCAANASAGCYNVDALLCFYLIYVVDYLT